MNVAFRRYRDCIIVLWSLIVHRFGRRLSAGPRPPDFVIGDIHVRPLRLDDAESWKQARARNADRMQHVWHDEPDRRANPDLAFTRHLMQWKRTVDNGSGCSLVFVARDEGVVGEVQLYRLNRGGSFEVGFWLCPVSTAKSAGVDVFVRIIDTVFGEWGAQRIDAPIEVGNRDAELATRRLGFTREGVLRQWRPAAASLASQDGVPRMSDITMYALIAEEWPAVRERLLSRTHHGHHTDR